MIRYLVNTLSAYRLFLPLIFIICFILCVIFFVITLVIIFHYIRARKCASDKVPPSASAAQGSSNKEDIYSLPPFLCGFSSLLSNFEWFQAGSMSQIFFKAHHFLKRTYPGPDYKYALPWYLMIGCGHSGKSKIAEHLENTMSSASPDFAQPLPRNSCHWSFFNDAVLLNLKGSFFLDESDITSNDEGWKTLSLLLTRYRNRLPLNGIVLTIPITDILGQKDPDLIKRRAYTMNKKLVDMQTFLGFQIPIYILITKADSVPGFQDFARAVPPANRQDPLGWSASFSPGTDYTSALFNQGFDDFESDFTQLSFDLLAHSDSSLKGGIFIFQEEILSIKNNLKIYMDHIFIGVLDRQRPILRGFYLTGDGLFLKNVFRKKIFEEQHLAQPFKSALRQNELCLTYLKYGTSAFVVIAAIAFAHVRSSFEKQSRALMPIVSNMAHLFEEMQSIHVGDSQKMRTIFEDASQQLVRFADDISQPIFFSVFVPATWFSPFRKNLSHTLKLTTQLILIRAIYCDLCLKMRTIIFIRPQKQDYSKTFGQVLLPTHSSEFKLLEKFVSDLENLYENVQKYNHFNVSHNPTILNDLLQYSFESKLPENFVARYSKLDRYVHNDLFPPIDFNAYQHEARKTLSILYQNFYNALFDPNTAYSLAARIQSFQKEFSPKDPALQPELKTMKETSASLNAVTDAMGKPGQTWLDKKTFDPGDNFTKVIDRINASPLFGKVVSKFLTDQTQFGFELTIKIIREFSDFMNGSLLDRSVVKEQESDVPPSQVILDFTKILQEIFEQPYILSEVPKDFIINVATDKVSFWKPEIVKSITADIDAYQAYLTKILPKVPIILQDKIRMALKTGLENYVEYSLSKAQETVAKTTMTPDQVEIFLRTRIESISMLTNEFNKILQFLSETKAGSTYVKFRQLLSDMANYLLGQADQMLERTQLYKVKDGNFMWWDGQKGSAFQAFGVVDGNSLKSYLDIQFAFLEKMQTFASPLVSFLTSDALKQADANVDLIEKWRQIVTEISDKKAGKPTSAIAQLNLFIENKMNDLDADNAYTEVPAAGVFEPSSNFFKERERLIKLTLLERAELVIRRRSMNNYYALQDAFNRLFKGRFPFISARSGVAQNEVSLDAIKEFFELYRVLGETPEKIMDKVIGLGAFVNPNVEFIRKLDALYQFFKPFLDGSAKKPGVDIDVTFHARRERERNTDFIMDLWFDPSASQSLTYSGKEAKKGRWNYGDPIKVGMRWANGADSTSPVLDGNLRNLEVNGKKAEYVFTSNWALFEMLESQRADVTGGNTYLVPFQVPQGNGSKAALVLGLDFSQDPKKSGGIQVPEFPQDVPRLSDELVNYLNAPYLLDKQNPYAKKS